jgi:hypothetical protein
MKRAGKPRVFCALIPEQRLQLHWPEAQETFLLNAKRSWGDQFFAHAPLDLLPPLTCFFLYSASIAVTVAAVPIVIRPHATTAAQVLFFLAIAFVGSLLSCLSTMRVPFY